MTYFNIIINISKNIFKNRVLIFSIYFFTYGIFSLPMILDEIIKLNSYKYELLYSLKNLKYIISALAFYISCSPFYTWATNNAIKLSKVNYNLKVLLKTSLKSKIYVTVILFGIFWFLHNKIEKYLSEDRVTGEAFIIDSNKICNWHLRQAIYKFERASLIDGEIVQQMGNLSNEISYYEKKRIRNGELSSFYYVEYYPSEYEKYEDFGVGGSYTSGEIYSGTSKVLKSRFWKVHDGKLIEGNGKYFEKY